MELKERRFHPVGGISQERRLGGGKEVSVFAGQKQPVFTKMENPWAG